MGVHSVAEVGVGLDEQERGEGDPVCASICWSRTGVGLRSDKMRGEIQRLGSQPWLAAQRRVRPHRRVRAGSSTVGLPCVPVLYACGSGTEPASKAAGTQPSPSKTDGARRREREWRRKCGPCGSHECRSSRRAKVEGGRRVTTKAGLLLSASYHLPAGRRLTTPPTGGLPLAREHAGKRSEEGRAGQLRSPPNEQ